MKSVMLRQLSALCLSLAAGSAVAGGFQNWGQSASGLGMAYAGSAALAEDASTIFYNPASISQLGGAQLSLGMAADGQRYRFRNQASSTAASDGGSGGDAGGWHTSPNAYFSWRLGQDWALGLGISTPFRLATEYNSTQWLGGAQAVKSDLKTVNYNPALAYRVNDRLALGIGLNYQTLDAEWSNTQTRFKGNDSALGWNAGALFTLSPAMRVGVSYRSAMKYQLEGRLNDGISANADLKLPDTFILSVWQQVSDRWEAMGDLSYTRWNTLKSVNVVRQSNSALVMGDAFNYDNAWRIAWGAAYKATDALKLKFGIAYDRTPTNDSNRLARMPDNDRLWFSFGGQWNAGPYGRLDLGYSYLYMKTANINQTKNGSTLLGVYDESEHLLGAQYSLGF